jgi:hypothetical protein
MTLESLEELGYQKLLGKSQVNWEKSKEALTKAYEQE